MIGKWLPRAAVIVAVSVYVFAVLFFASIFVTVRGPISVLGGVVMFGGLGVLWYVYWKFEVLQRVWKAGERGYV